MLEEKFQKIETYLLEILAKFLIKVLDKSPNELKDDEIVGIIDLFLANYETIANNVGWNEFYKIKEYKNRAWLIKDTRNKYYHTTIDSHFDKMDELADLTNILLFVRSMQEYLYNDSKYQEFIKYLEYSILYVFNETEASNVFERTNSPIENNQQKIKVVLKKNS